MTTRRPDIYERARCIYCGQPISGLTVCAGHRPLLTADPYQAIEAVDELDLVGELELEQLAFPDQPGDTPGHHY